MAKVDVLILTKSAKHGEYCVSGINLQSGRWIRLVSSDASTMYALTRDMVKYINGVECQILDVVRVEVKCACSLEIQTENVLIDKTKYFKFIRKASIREVEQYLNNEMIIYGGVDSYINNRNLALSFGYSLRMYKVNNLVLSEHENNRGSVRKKLSFDYKGIHYNNWSMTDYEFFNIMPGKIADEGIIIVSIPEDDYNGNYYKFVAKIFI